MFFCLGQNWNFFSQAGGSPPSPLPPWLRACSFICHQHQLKCSLIMMIDKRVIGDTMDHVQGQQSVQSVVVQQPRNSNIDNDVKIDTVIIAFHQSWCQLYKITLQYWTSQQEFFEIYIKNCQWKNIASQLRCEGKYNTLFIY